MALIGCGQNEPSFTEQEAPSPPKAICEKLADDIASKRSYLTVERVESETETQGVIYCDIRFQRDEIHYTLPVIWRVTYSRATGNYTMKQY